MIRSRVMRRAVGYRSGVFVFEKFLAVRVLDRIVRRVCPAERVALP